MVWREAMDVIDERVAGLDVDKPMVVACVRRVSGHQVSRECRSFATTTAGLLALPGLAGRVCVLTRTRAPRVKLRGLKAYGKNESTPTAARAPAG